MKRAVPKLPFVLALVGASGFCVGEAAGQTVTSAPKRLSPVAVRQMTLEDLIQIGLERNPRLAQASFVIDRARGRAVQSGLYPNPNVSVTGDELGDRQGPGGIWTAPYVSQEIVTGGKLKLSKAAADRELDQATLALVSQRYALLTAIRQSYYEVLSLQRKLDILQELVKISETSVEATRKLLEAKLPGVTRLDLLQLELELERHRAEREAIQRELPAAFRRLAAVVGVSDLPFSTLAGSMEIGLPDYDLDNAREYLLQFHPQIQSAQLGVDRARLLLRRAQAEAIPNVTVGGGYVRQNQNKSDDWTIGVSVPLPVWNRNQGNIRAAEAHIGEVLAAVGRIENELVERLAAAFATYSSAHQRADRYRTAILPKARETFKLSIDSYKGGQFEYLRVLQAQRALAEANLEYNRALGDLWRGASEIAGLLLEEGWPTPPPVVPAKPKP
ncbi:MAG: TolC family protein [Planctomycetes bacterium]|nr:TolC family protein [Planctomycetota bacterium]